MFFFPRLTFFSQLDYHKNTPAPAAPPTAPPPPPTAPATAPAATAPAPAVGLETRLRLDPQVSSFFHVFFCCSTDFFFYN
jgi:hypothetical protein